jgi:hypothetical protein
VRVRENEGVAALAVRVRENEGVAALAVRVRENEDAAAIAVRAEESEDVAAIAVAKVRRRKAMAPAREIRLPQFVAVGAAVRRASRERFAAELR